MANHMNSLLTFDATTDENIYARKRAKSLVGLMNACPITRSIQERADIWHNLTGLESETERAKLLHPIIGPSFSVDYGTKLDIDPSVIINRGCVFVDSPVRAISIGPRSVLGPDVRIIAATGTYGPSDTGLTYTASDVRIGKDCNIGACTVILPGVSIGDYNNIPVDSVVRESIPAALALSSRETDTSDARVIEGEVESHVRRRRWPKLRALEDPEGGNNSDCDTLAARPQDPVERRDEVLGLLGMPDTTGEAFALVAMIFLVFRGAKLQDLVAGLPNEGHWWDFSVPMGVIVVAMVVLLLMLTGEDLLRRLANRMPLVY
ncbi:hypothetical protein LTR95_000895 [Oleoguttula sp. CCFEE 5521]